NPMPGHGLSSDMRPCPVQSGSREVSNFRGSLHTWVILSRPLRGGVRMPWKECSVMDERLQFVGRRLAGELMAQLCREFGVSRKTGYKIFERYQECGVQGLTDRSRRPYRYAHQLPFQVENYILNVKREHPSWGARKIRDRLARRFSGIK